MRTGGQLSFRFDDPIAPLPMEGEGGECREGWDVPIVPEGDPKDRVKRIVKALEKDYQYFGGWGLSLEVSLDVILAALESREEDYKELASGMKPEAMTATCTVFGELLQGFCIDYNIWDYLGEVYMELGSLSKHQAFGQFFTPSHICEAMALMSLGDVARAIEKAERGSRNLTVHDPACGSGAMLLGAKRAIIKAVGLSGLDWFRFSGNDIDGICVKMAKVQMIMTDYRFMVNWMLLKGHEAARQGRGEQ